MNNFYKGMAAGLIAGATISSLASSMEPKSMKFSKKNIGRAVKNMGNIISRMSE